MGFLSSGAQGPKNFGSLNGQADPSASISVGQFVVRSLVQAAKRPGSGGFLRLLPLGALNKPLRAKGARQDGFCVGWQSSCAGIQGANAGLRQKSAVSAWQCRQVRDSTRSSPFESQARYFPNWHGLVAGCPSGTRLAALSTVGASSPCHGTTPWTSRRAPWSRRPRGAPAFERARVSVSPGPWFCISHFVPSWEGARRTPRVAVAGPARDWRSLCFTFCVPVAAGHGCARSYRWPEKGTPFHCTFASLWTPLPCLHARCGNQTVSVDSWRAGHGVVGSETSRGLGPGGVLSSLRPDGCEGNR